MTNHLSSETSTVLLNLRRIAFIGHQEVFFKAIDAYMAEKEQSLPCPDLVALGMLKSELLFLEYQNEPAMDIFDRFVMPKLGKLPTEMALIVQDNMNMLAQEMIRPNSANEFYNLVDFRRLAGIELWNKSAILTADEAMAEGKHYEALPAYWRQLARSYRLGSWRAFRWSSHRLAKEFLSLGQPWSAVHHAVMAGDRELAGDIGDSLLRLCDPEKIVYAVEKVLANANLARHRVVAAKLIGGIADAIPENQLKTVLNWVLPVCGLLFNVKLFTNAWEAVTAIAPLLAAEDAREVVKTAVNHVLWRSASIHRKILIEAVHRCIASLAAEALPDLAKDCLWLVTDMKSDFDYYDAVNLLCYLAERNETAKAIIGEVLFPAGMQGMTAVQVQIAPIWGKTLDNETGIAETARRVAERIRTQVQRLTPGVEPIRASGSIGQLHVNAGDNHKVVNIMGNNLELTALVTHRRSLSEESLRILIQAILDMIVEPENLLSNKCSLIETIAELADSLPEPMAEFVYEILSPLAEGEVSEPSVTMKSAEVANPLNPFKINLGTPAQVRGSALEALAEIEKNRPGIYAEPLHLLLEKALVDINPEIRRHAHRAAHSFPALPESVIMSVLLGTQDPDPKTAEWALGAIATSENLELRDYHWRALICTLIVAKESPHVNLRRVAAFTAAKLKRRVPPSFAESINQIVLTLADDICHSVRQAAMTAEREL